jgi:cytochrome c-type biogenesis protein CcmH/NrfG
MTADTSDALTKRAQDCERRGDLKGAAEAYRSCLEQCPNDADMLAQLGQIYARDGLEDDAILAYEGALTYVPEHFGAHVGIARVLSGKGWHHGALVVLEALERMRPGDPAAHDEVVRARDAIAQFRETGQG